MKKVFTLLFVLSIFSIMSFAQMQAGLKAGLNLANLSGDDAGSPDSKTAFAFGGFFAYQFSPMFAIQPEIYYSMKGATDNMTFEGATVDITYTFDYIEIPLLLKFMIPIQGSNIKPAIFAGPHVAINTTAKVKAEYQGDSQEEDIEDFKSSEFGLQFGGGVGFPVGKGELGFDIRYIMGLSTIFDVEGDPDVKNSVINFNLFYAFSLK
jgi:hypothetical protein